MNSSPLTYTDCYRCLEIAETASWSEVKHAYRKQSQKWHPDKVKYTQHDPQTAEQRFKTVQQAYEILEKYYRTYETLPPLESSPANHSADELAPANHSAPARAWPSPPGASKKTPSRVFPILLTAILLTGLGYVFWQSANSDEFSVATQNSATAPMQTVKPPLSSQRISPPAVATQKTFSYGSTMGQVTEVQGIPSRIEQNIWYYGTSKVVFKDGVVADWTIDENYPLNVSLSYTASSPTQKTGHTAVHRIYKGMHKQQVRLIQGDPMQDLGDTWVYGTSRIFFKDGRVSSWINSTLNPLKVE